jgi:hypothetical protein
MAAMEKVIVERLPDLGGWELYRLALEQDDDVVATIALRKGAGGVEYGVWRREDAEPSATGLLDRAAESAWSDVTRELTLQEVLAIYAKELPELRGGVVFKIDGAAEDTDDDDDDTEDDGDDD